MRADLLREKRKMSEENAQQWNFDFENGVPLVGRYVWERICSTLTTEKPGSSLPDSVNGTGANQRLGCFSVPSTELTTATTTTSSDATKCPVSNDSCPNHAENDLAETKKHFRHIRKTRSTGKITDLLRSTKQRTSEKRSRPTRRNSKPKQTSMDLFVRKH